MLRDFGLRRRDPAADFQITIAGKRKKIRERPRNNGETVMRKMQIGDDLRVEQADRIARRRISKSRMEFLGDRGATDDRTALEDAHRCPAGSEIGGADEAVVAAADDDDVESA